MIVQNKYSCRWLCNSVAKLTLGYHTGEFLGPSFAHDLKFELNLSFISFFFPYIYIYNEDKNERFYY